MGWLLKGLAWTGTLVLVCFFCALSSGSASAQESVDSKRDCLAASERGQNERDEGRFRAARQSFVRCSRDVCPRVVTDLCTKWLHELDQAAPTIVLSAKDEQDNDLADVRVEFDGAPFATVLDGKPIEVDAGAHVLRFEREGSDPVEQVVTIRAGERARLVTVTLRATGRRQVVPGPDQKASTRISGGLGETAIAGGSAGSSSKHSSTAQFATAGAIALGGLAAVGTGVYFLVQSNQRGDEAANLRRDLGGTNACTQQLSLKCQQLDEKVHAQHDAMTIAMTFFVGGGLLAAGALATLFLWPAGDNRPAQTSAWIAPTQGGLTLQVARRFP